jgi:hypothetical protein
MDEKLLQLRLEIIDRKLDRVLGVLDQLLDALDEVPDDIVDLDGLTVARPREEGLEL